jgi:hypothetical protein
VNYDHIPVAAQLLKMFPRTGDLGANRQREIEAATKLDHGKYPD